MNTKETKVISFRTSVELADRLDKQAKKAKKVRGKFVENLVLTALGLKITEKLAVLEK